MNANIRIKIDRNNYDKIFIIIEAKKERKKGNQWKREDRKKVNNKFE